MTVTAIIDTSTPTGRRIVRDLEKHKKIVKLEYPQPLDANGNPRILIPAEEVYEKVWDMMSEHYGVDVRKL
ncbi:MAG: hypothetical protein ACOYOT_05730 [Bacteroidales bacterium]